MLLKSFLVIEEESVRAALALAKSVVRIGQIDHFT
jgi:hypothetical protein